MSAADIAKSAYEQAKEAEARRAEALKEKARIHAEIRAQAHQHTFEAALPTLQLWFPGVEWACTTAGDFDYDTIVWDASESWPPFFKLLVERYGGKVRIKIGDYVPDTSMPGYNYFSGGEVKCAADIGRYLENAGK